MGRCMWLSNDANFRDSMGVKMSGVFAFFGYAGLVVFGCLLVLFFFAWLFKDGFGSN